MLMVEWSLYIIVARLQQHNGYASTLSPCLPSGCCCHYLYYTVDVLRRLQTQTQTDETDETLISTFSPFDTDCFVSLFCSARFSPTPPFLRL
jgi:hypothetical protein